VINNIHEIISSLLSLPLLILQEDIIDGFLFVKIKEIRGLFLKVNVLGQVSHVVLATLLSTLND
jgi:hypothetical protein